MRIIGGRFRRRPLRAPKGDQTRPTTDRARESIFNLLYSRMDLEGAQVLDLFAGTGALGLEALSRGARSVVFVEHHPPALRVARENAAALDVERACVFYRADALAFLERYTGPPFDLILADPPYELNRMAHLPDLALAALREGGLFVLEHDTRIRFDEHPALDTSRPYGRTLVSLFEKAST